MDGWIVKNGVQDNHLDRVGRLPNELIRRHLSTEERRLEKASEGSDIDSGWNEWLDRSLVVWGGYTDTSTAAET